MRLANLAACLSVCCSKGATHCTAIGVLYNAALQTHLDTWSKEWELGIAEQRMLYLAAAEVLRLSKVG